MPWTSTSIRPIAVGLAIFAPFCEEFEKVAVTDWIFNGWAKYDNWLDDNAVPMFVSRQLGMHNFEPGMVLEGGSIDVNGRGSLITTEECLLSDVQARNPGWSRAQIEQKFSDYLGIDDVIWLRNGIAGDDTHGHVDDITRFTDAHTIVTVLEPDKSDYNYEPTREPGSAAGSQGSADRDLADAVAGVLRWSAAASELCEFLHREQAGAGADVPGQE